MLAVVHEEQASLETQQTILDKTVVVIEMHAPAIQHVQHALEHIYYLRELE